MTHEPPKKITIPEGSSLGKLLTDAAVWPILLGKNGELYRLERMETEGNTPSPADIRRSREGILKAAGSCRALIPRRLKRISKTGATLRNGFGTGILRLSSKHHHLRGTLRRRSLCP
jgi:hypothetical protein